MQGPRLIWEGRKDHLVFCDQGNTQLLRSCHELTVVGAAAAAAGQCQHLLRRHGLLMGREDCLGFLLDFLPGLKAGDSFYAADEDASAIGWVGASQPAATARVD